MHVRPLRWQACPLLSARDACHLLNDSETWHALKILCLPVAMPNPVIYPGKAASRDPSTPLSMIDAMLTQRWRSLWVEHSPFNGLQYMYCSFQVCCQFSSDSVAFMLYVGLFVGSTKPGSESLRSRCVKENGAGCAMIRLCVEKVINLHTFHDSNHPLSSNNCSCCSNSAVASRTEIGG